MLSVMPTGVFQPASILPTHDTPDFDMWHNMMREYSEEFLGNPEHDGDGDPIDYARQEPFRSLDAARNAGKIRVLEQSFALLHWFRRLRIRWEIRDDIHEAFLSLACGIIW